MLQQLLALRIGGGPIHAEGRPGGEVGLKDEDLLFRLLFAVRIEFAFNSSFYGKIIGRSSIMVAV